VDNRNFRRLSYRVLNRSPRATDIAAFLQEFKEELDKRGLSARGITTDGSHLYPQAIADVFGSLPHQICRFHTLKELTTAVLRAVARIRKRQMAHRPILPRGRPTKANRPLLARGRRARQRIRDLFDHRHLFVIHHLTRAEKRRLRRMIRGKPQLRVLRQIMDQIYTLFDRRCRSETALVKLAQLRRRVRKFKAIGKTLQRLFSANLEKALTFLNDKLLPSTSNAVERGNRRHRKMQKSIYRVRTRISIHRRMALDLLRERRNSPRCNTTATLHRARATATITL